MSINSNVRIIRCQWKDDGENNFETQCGEVFTLIHGTPAENNYNYCPHCGFKIRLKKLN